MIKFTTKLLQIAPFFTSPLFCEETLKVVEAQSLPGVLLKTFGVLFAIIALSYLVLHKGLGTYLAKKQLQGSLQGVERIALDQRNTLFIVSLDNKRLLLGSAGGSLSLLRELDVSEPRTDKIKEVGNNSLFGNLLKRSPKEEQLVTN